MPISKMELITPTKAKKWLDSMGLNRRINRATSDTYAAAIRSGNWQDTGDTIKFDEYGKLSDGQHRCQAVIDSGVSIRMAVVRGVKREAMAAIDSGKPRTVTDRVIISGIDTNPKTTAIANKMHTRGAANHAKLEAYEIGPFIELHRDVIELCAEMFGSCKGVGQASIKAVVARALYTQDNSRVRRFVDILTSREPWVKGNASEEMVNNFRNDVIANPSRSGSKRIQLYEATKIALWTFLKGGSRRPAAMADEPFLLPGEKE